MKSKSFETVLYSTLGVLIMLMIVVAVNFMSSLVRYRADLTEEKLYTLSDGTKAILSKLDGKLKIRFYCTQNDPAMPVAWANYAQRIEDLLAEYKKVSGGKIEIEKLNPQPDTDAEEFASLDGVEPRQVSLSDSVYLGLGFTRLDTKSAVWSANEPDDDANGPARPAALAVRHRAAKGFQREAGPDGRGQT
jgi:hypothetical protein